MGGNVPTPAFLAAVKQYRPGLVLVYAHSEEALENTIQLTRGLANLKSKRLRFQIGVGGCGRNLDRFLEAGADFCTDSLDDFARRCLPELDK